MGVSRRRILFVVSEYVEKGNPLGGIFFRDQALALQRIGLRADVVYVEPRSLRQLSLRTLRENRFQVTEEEEDGLLTLRRHAWNPAMRIVAGGLTWSRMTERLIARYVHRWGLPDIVHAQNTVWAGHVARRVCDAYRLPYVITEHSTAFLMEQTAPGAEPFIRRALANAARVLAVSPRLAESMGRFAGDRPIEVLPNLVDVDFFALPTARESLPFVFLTVAALTPRKALDILVRAFAHAFREDHATELHLGGDGPERKALEAMVRELGIESRVRFLGGLTRAGVRDAMHAANAFVLPSYFETFGLVLIEALSTGIPVVATRSGGPEGFVTPELGLLVDVGDIAQLADALREIRSGRRYDANTLRRHVVAHYSGEAIGGRLMSLYDEILEERR